MDFSKTHISWSRPITDYAKVKAGLGHLLRGQRIQLARSSAFRKPYLNIGCGPNVHPRFVNIDYCWHPGVDLVWDVVKGIPFGDQSYEGAFTEHCLEHITLDQCRFVLHEVRRVLKPGAIVRIVVPDAGKYLEIYQRRKGGIVDPFPYEEQRLAAGQATPMMIVNDIFRGHGHLYAYDTETLVQLLSEQGYVDVKVVQFGTGSNPDLLLDSAGRKVESLYIEALA